MKPIDERNADLLEKFTLALGVAAFVGAEDLEGFIYFALGAMVCYIMCVYITLKHTDKSDPNDLTGSSSH